MAQITNSISFKNAIIDLENNQIIELNKDTEQQYSLSEVFSRFQDKYVSLTIKENSELGYEG